MNKPQPHHRRSRAEYRWTNPKIAAFLRELAATGSVTKAARSVGMSRQSAYTLRVRLMAEGGLAFARLWDEALAIALSRRVARQGAKVRAHRFPSGAPPGVASRARRHIHPETGTV